MSNDPLHRFEAEHREVLAALDRLEAAASALESGAAPAAHLATAREIYALLTTTVRQHNDDEERALFDMLEDLAPAEVFTKEHKTLHGLERRLGRALDGPAPARDVVGPALDIVRLLRAHIQREDEVLFPMARVVLGPQGLAVVAGRLGS